MSLNFETNNLFYSNLKETKNNNQAPINATQISYFTHNNISDHTFLC